MKLVAAALLLSTSLAFAQEEVDAKDAQAWVEVFDKIVDSVVANRADCGKMATSVAAVIDANEPTIAKVRAAKLAGKKFPASMQQHMVDNVRRMAGSLDKCGRDDKVAAAFARLDLGGHGN